MVYINLPDSLGFHTFIDRIIIVRVRNALRTEAIYFFKRLKAELRRDSDSVGHQWVKPCAFDLRDARQGRA
jgi:hypothetical protein